MKPARRAAAPRRAAPRARRARPAVLGVAGASGAGKTRLLVRLIPALTSLGLRVAAVKHSSHDHPLDRRGKDSQRLRAAGAEAVAVQTASAMALFGPPLRGVEDVVALLPAVDVVLVEGWKSSALPKLEVHRRRVARGFLCAADAQVVAVVSDEPPPRALPTFEADDVEGIAAFVARWVSGRKPRPRAARRRPAPASR